jgi:hypothetical protein
MVPSDRNRSTYRDIEWDDRQRQPQGDWRVPWEEDRQGRRWLTLFGHWALSWPAGIFRTASLRQGWWVTAGSLGFFQLRAKPPSGKWLLPEGFVLPVGVALFAVWLFDIALSPPLFSHFALSSLRLGPLSTTAHSPLPLIVLHTTLLPSSLTPQPFFDSNRPTLRAFRALTLSYADLPYSSVPYRSTYSNHASALSCTSSYATTLTNIMK